MQTTPAPTKEKQVLDLLYVMNDGVTREQLLAISKGYRNLLLRLRKKGYSIKYQGKKWHFECVGLDVDLNKKSPILFSIVIIADILLFGVVAFTLYGLFSILSSL